MVHTSSIFSYILIEIKKEKTQINITLVWVKLNSNPFNKVLGLSWSYEIKNMIGDETLLTIISQIFQ